LKIENWRRPGFLAIPATISLQFPAHLSSLPAAKPRNLQFSTFNFQFTTVRLKIVKLQLFLMIFGIEILNNAAGALKGL
jgi:hypothetical protein